MLTDDDEKTRWGKQNVGTPALQIQEAMDTLKGMEEFSGVQFEAIEFYRDQFLFNHVLEALDSALSVDELKALNPDVTKVVFILLIRDFIRRNQARLIPTDFPQKWPGQWVELFTAKMLELTDAPVQIYVDWIASIPNGEKEEPVPLIFRLAKQIGLSPTVLIRLHDGMCEAIEKRMFSGSNSKPKKRPW